MKLLADMLCSVIKYNISLLDYFYFNFYGLDSYGRELWAGTGFMYEYQKKMNPKKCRRILEDKIQFLKYYEPFIKRKYLIYQDALMNLDELRKLLKNNSGKLVLKGALGQIGNEVKVIQCNDYSEESLLLFMKKNKLDLIEEFVVQHSSLMKLSPTGLNTIRIFTQIHNGKFYILGARLRITVNSLVDNMAAGNLAASIDVSNGVVNGPAVYSDISKEGVLEHPITGISIGGFKIPHWNETLRMVENAAMYDVQNKSIGWDIAISQEGPELIEGNHNWCKLLWQLPVNRGMKSELMNFL